MHVILRLVELYLFIGVALTAFTIIHEKHNYSLQTKFDRAFIVLLLVFLWPFIIWDAIVHNHD